MLLLAAAGTFLTSASAVPRVDSALSIAASAELDSAAAARSRLLLRSLQSEFLSLLIRIDPVRATVLGLAEGDETLGPAGGEAARAAWSRFGSRLVALADSVGRAEDEFDLGLMLFETERRLYELDSLRVRETDPRWGPRTALTGIQGLLQRSTISPEARSRALAGRMGEIPSFLGALSGSDVVVSLFVAEQALAFTDALTRVLLEEVPAATAGGEDSVLTARLGDLEAAALQAVWEYREWLTDRVLPRAEPEFAVGAERLSSFLRGMEWIDEPLDTLRDRADRELLRLEEAFLATAAGIDSTLDSREVLEAIQADHPAPGEVLPEMEEDVHVLRLFVEADGSVPFPDPVSVQVFPQPRSSRWTHASLVAPGPFEPGNPPSALYVAVPDRLAPAAEQAELQRFLNRSLLRNLAVHEAYPGHALQAAYQRRLAPAVRRAVSSSLFVEGWAHYGEVLVLERGYRAEDPRFRLVTLQSELRRAGRMRAILGLQAEGWSVEEAALLFEERCFLEPSIARREALRSAGDPLALSYTLGRLELEALRAERERAEGDAFDLRRFHEQVLSLGAPPLPLLRSMLSP